jgi:hypothetical protein
LETGIPLILWIGEDEVAKGIVKVKSLNHHEEYVIERAKLVEKVRELVAANPVLLSQALQAELKKTSETAEKE